MKRLILSAAILLSFASASHAEMSFLTANAIGEGRFSFTPIAVWRHYGSISNVQFSTAEGGDQLRVFDFNGVGGKFLFGVNDSLDIFFSMTSDTYPFAPNFDEFAFGPSTESHSKQVSGSTTSAGLKFTVLKASADVPFDLALALGYEWGDVSISYSGSDPSMNKDVGYSRTGYLYGGIISGHNEDLGVTPFMSLYYRTLSLGDNIFMHEVSGYGFAGSIGLMYDLSSDWQLGVEYWKENQILGDIQFKDGSKSDQSSNTFQGIDLGLKWMI